MLKNLRRKAPEKEKLLHDLFHLRKTHEHGFTSKPSAIAYDHNLQILAVGTQTGDLKIFGRSGVELFAHEPSTTSSCIQQLHFLEDQGRLISVCDDGEHNSLHLWEINNPHGHQSELEEVKACTLEGRLKKISVCCLSIARQCLYIGTEGGHIYTLDLKIFELKDYVIYQDIVLQSLPEEVGKMNGGSVEALQEHPTEFEKMLIGYKKGLIVLWNQDNLVIEESFLSSQDIESLHWHANHRQFISAHAYGSLSVWDLPEEEGGDVRQETTTPFGPFPCKAIQKVIWCDPLTIFSGGLQRASYGDKHCISMLEASKVQVVLDFTSKLVDFLTIGSEDGVPVCLVVLCEEEIVFIDLQDKSYPVYQQPYLACIHSSNITVSTHVSKCPTSLWEFLMELGKKQLNHTLTETGWPITGGKSLIKKSEDKDLLVTGHEDGTIKFWNVSGYLFHLICTISTAKLFKNDYDEAPAAEGGEEDWPKFKKVGQFDPFSDDPRLVIQKLYLCPSSEMLMVGGSGGQCIIYKLNENHDSFKLQDVNVIENLEGFEWKGLGPLTTSTNACNFEPTPCKVIQLIPAAPITALAADTFAGVISAGTCHGFLVFDVFTNNIVLVKCTVNPTDLANTGAGIQRKRTLAKSLRDSFRRLKSRRGSHRKKAGEPSSNNALKSYEVAAVTRLVDENRVDEAVLSMVRCLYFGETFLGDSVSPALTLWAGTNAGYIYVYSITLPEKSQRAEKLVKAEVGKELKLKHHAPVINIFVVDKNGVPLISAGESEAGRLSSPDMSGAHSVVISSEEQFKVFSLPTLRPKNKEKLTAVDGSRVRKLGVVQVKGATQEQDDIHYCLACLTNQGEVSVYSIPHLKIQIKGTLMKKEDISAISSLVFTSDGEGFFLKSPSELQRFGLLANTMKERGCVIPLKRGMRPYEDED